MDAWKPATTKQRPPLVRIVVVAMLMGWLVVHFTWPDEPSYQGRRLSQWFKDYNEATGNEVILPEAQIKAQAAKHAIKEIGTNAIPIYLKWVQANSPIEEKLDSLLAKHDLIDFRFSEDGRKRLDAATGFLILGNDALSAVSSLTQVLQSPNLQTRSWAFECLVLIDNDKKACLPVFRDLIKSSDGYLRGEAAKYLGERYPVEGEKAGVCKMFPLLQHPKSKSVETLPQTRS